MSACCNRCPAGAPSQDCASTPLRTRDRFSGPRGGAPGCSAGPLRENVPVLLATTGKTTPPFAAAAAYVTRVEVASSYSPGQVAYKEGEAVTVRLTFSEPVSLTGVDAGGANEARVALTVGTASRTAVAAAATSGSATLDLAYTVQAGDNDADGVAIEGGLVLGGTAAVRDADGIDAVLSFNAVADVPSAEVVTAFAALPAPASGEGPRRARAGRRSGAPTRSWASAGTRATPRPPAPA